MARIIAIFDDDGGITKANDALAEAGYGDDIERVIEGPVSPGKAALAQPAVGGGQGGVVANPGGAGMPNMLGTIDLRTDGLPEEMQTFLADSLEDGAHLLILDTDNQSEVERILKDAGASRVHSD